MKQLCVALPSIVGWLERRSLVAANRTLVPLAEVSVYWPGQIGVISSACYHLSLIPTLGNMYKFPIYHCMCYKCTFPSCSKVTLLCGLLSTTTTSMLHSPSFRRVSVLWVMQWVQVWPTVTRSSLNAHTTMIHRMIQMSSVACASCTLDGRIVMAVYFAFLLLDTCCHPITVNCP